MADAPGSINWTAIYPTLSAGDQQLAVAGLSGALWLGTFPATVVEATFTEFGVAPGPLPGCAVAAPFARYAVTHSSPGAVNIANAAGGITISGSSQDAASVVATLTDGVTTLTAPVVTPTPAAGPQSWSATFTGAQVSTLTDGSLTASGTYSLSAGGTITGTTLSILKSTVAPAGPTASPPGGLYALPQSVTLINPRGLPMFFTLDGTAPTAASTRYVGPVSITATETLKAIAVDGAGNPSPASADTYTAGAPTAGLPASVAFSSEPVGIAGAPSPVTLTNTGNLNLVIAAVAITGANSADFAKLSDTCSGASVVPGASCAIGVAFAPTTNGPRTASLTVTDNAAGGSQSVALSGTGVAPANNLSFTTTFANQAIGSSSLATTLRITNAGSVNELLGSVGIVGANAGDFAKLGDTCSSATLVPGATCDISIAFVPTAVGARSAIVSVPSAIAGTSQTMALSGVGI